MAREQERILEEFIGRGITGGLARRAIGLSQLPDLGREIQQGQVLRNLLEERRQSELGRLKAERIGLIQAEAQRIARQAARQQSQTDRRFNALSRLVSLAPTGPAQPGQAFNPEITQLAAALGLTHGQLQGILGRVTHGGEEARRMILDEFLQTGEVKQFGTPRIGKPVALTGFGSLRESRRLGLGSPRTVRQREFREQREQQRILDQLLRSFVPQTVAASRFPSFRAGRFPANIILTSSGFGVRR